MIAEELVAPGRNSTDDSTQQLTYMEGEVTQRLLDTPVKLPPVRKDCKYHLYCSPYTARDATQQLAEQLKDEYLPTLTWTEDPRQLSTCEHMVILLTDDMWTRQGASEAFAHEVCEAMRQGVHRLLVHEVPGARLKDNEERHACSFEQIIATTPKHVCQARLYNEIAQNVADAELRKVGLAKMAIKLAEGSGSRSEWTFEPDEPEPDVVRLAVRRLPRHRLHTFRPCACSEH
jgi:hypothetical protein